MGRRFAQCRVFELCSRPNLQLQENLFVACTDTAAECVKMFDCCEVSDVIVKRKLKFLQRYARSDIYVCHVTSIWLEICHGHVCGSFSV